MKITELEVGKKYRLLYMPIGEYISYFKNLSDETYFLGYYNDANLRIGLVSSMIHIKSTDWFEVEEKTDENKNIARLEEALTDARGKVIILRDEVLDLKTKLNEPVELIRKLFKALTAPPYLSYPFKNFELLVATEEFLKQQGK